MEVVSIKALKCILDHFGKEYSQKRSVACAEPTKSHYAPHAHLEERQSMLGFTSFMAALLKSALAICVTATLIPESQHLEFIIVTILLKFPSPWHAQASYC